MLKSAPKPRSKPTGPAACYRMSRISVPCDVCHAYQSPVHTLLTGPGFFCAQHCQHCNPAAVTQ